MISRTASLFANAGNDKDCGYTGSSIQVWIWNLLLLQIRVVVVTLKLLLGMVLLRLWLQWLVSLSNYYIITIWYRRKSKKNERSRKKKSIVSCSVLLCSVAFCLYDDNTVVTRNKMMRKSKCICLMDDEIEWLNRRESSQAIKQVKWSDDPKRKISLSL